MGRNAVIGLGLVAMLALPAAASAARPAKADKRMAVKECKLERGTTPAERHVFREAHGTNRNGRNAFGVCVRRGVREERVERRQARREAVRDCRTERRDDVGAFRDKYGTNRNRRNAFGMCVSRGARQERRAEDREDRREIRQQRREVRNAARECADERSADPAAFRETHGTNRNGHNAFGMCVSGKVRADQGEGGPENGESENGGPRNGQPQNGQPQNGQPENGQPENGGA